MTPELVDLVFDKIERTQAPGQLMRFRNKSKESGIRLSGLGAGATAWISKRSDGIHLKFTSGLEQRYYGANDDMGYGVVMKEGFDVMAAVSVVAACYASAALPLDFIRGLLEKKNLTSDGNVPGRGSIKSVQDGILRVLRKENISDDIYDVAPWITKRDGTLRAIPRGIVLGVTKLQKIYGGLSGEDLRRSLEIIREQFQIIMRQVEFDTVKQIWDEELVRDITDS